jgi:hypothetical protein
MRRYPRKVVVMTIEETLKATVEECLKGAVKLEPKTQTVHVRHVSDAEPKTQTVHVHHVSDAEIEERARKLAVEGAKWGWQRQNLPR